MASPISAFSLPLLEWKQSRMNSRHHILLCHVHDAIWLFHNVAASSGCKQAPAQIALRLPVALHILASFLREWNNLHMLWTSRSNCLFLSVIYIYESTDKEYNI